MKYRCSALLVSLALFANMPGASAAPGPFCDVTLAPSDSIQAAVDGVGEGGVVCLANGTHFVGSTPINLDSTHTGLTLRAVEGAYPILQAGEEAIRLNEAHEVTISGLILEGDSSNRHCSIRIFHSDNVTVAHNEIRDFNCGVSIAPSLSSPPMNPNGFVLSDNEIFVRNDGLVLINCTGCSVIRNQIDTPSRAIFVWASNRVRGLTEEEIIRGTKIVENQITGRVGIAVLAEVEAGNSLETTNFVSTEVISVQQNQITARSPIIAFANADSRFGGSLAAAATAKIKNLGMIRNEIVCVPFSGNENGVQLVSSRNRLQDVAVIENTKIIRNTFSGCSTNVLEQGDVERTAMSPDLQELLDFLDVAAAEGAY